MLGGREMAEEGSSKDMRHGGVGLVLEASCSNTKQSTQNGTKMHTEGQRKSAFLPLIFVCVYIPIYIYLMPIFSDIQNIAVRNQKFLSVMLDLTYQLST